jgi:Protein of unknown function (DUF2510)
MSDLSRLPAPRRGAKEGYYPDPLGTGRARWWDGSKWTMRVGPPEPPGAAKGKPIPAPERKPTSPWAVAAAIAAACLAILLTLGGCAALVVVGLNEAEDEIDETAITKEQYDLIDLGTPESVVRARLGDPLSEESFNRPPVECIYYAQKDEGVFGIDDFQFCFRNGVLDSKSADGDFLD